MEKLSFAFVLACALSSRLIAADADARIEVSAKDRRPTLFIIGDSTVRNRTAGQLGWGDVIGDYFDTNKIRVENHAIAGRSSRTFLTEGRWDKIAAELKPGDFVLMQFGHNDGGPINDDSRARGSIRGVGNETQEIDNLLTKKHEVVHTYGWYMRKYIHDTRTNGATPIVLSLIPRKMWKDGKIVRSDNYRRWAIEVARGEKAAFADLYEVIARRYEALGSDKVNGLFGDDHTHTNRDGAEINAACVIAGLKGLEHCALCESFSSKAATIEKFTSGDLE